MSPWTLLLAFALLFCHNIAPVCAKTCTLSPLGNGRDDTDQVEQAIADCGRFGTTVFQSGDYVITRKMTWNLTSSRVDLKGFLNFKPDILYWLNPFHTYRVVFIQSQASWFIVTGSDFVIDAHNTGGIQGNGQPWWSFFQTHVKFDGNGRPISLTLWRATRGTIMNFRIISPPFWSNAVAESSDIMYDGMYINATNTDPLYFGQNAVPNTDGIDTYRSNNISMFNWDVTCGDDCLAIKGNSSNIHARNITCRGGSGVAFGSLGQYVHLADIVTNVTLENLSMVRLDPMVQPNMGSGVYFKTFTGSSHLFPPIGGGGGSGSVSNVIARGVRLDRVSTPLHLSQTRDGQTGDKPSTISFNNLSFSDWTGTAVTNTIVDMECSPASGCNGMTFDGFDIAGPEGQTSKFICQNVQGLLGLLAPCNATGSSEPSFV